MHHNTMKIRHDVPNNNNTVDVAKNECHHHNLFMSNFSVYLHSYSVISYVYIYIYIAYYTVTIQIN